MILATDPNVILGFVSALLVVGKMISNRLG